MRKKQSHGLERFLPKAKKKSKKPIYLMTRFDARPDLFQYMHDRTKKLNVSKVAYILALIEQDKASSK